MIENVDKTSGIRIKYIFAERRRATHFLFELEEKEECATTTTATSGKDESLVRSKSVGSGVRVNPEDFKRNQF